MKKNFYQKGICCFILGSLIFSCSDEWKKDVPEVSEVTRGFSYNILEQEGDCKLFLRAIERSGYSDLFMGKGLSTVFVPRDDAFNTWLITEGHGDIERVPLDELTKLVGLHIVQYSLSEDLFLNFQPYIEGLPELPGICYRQRTFARDSVFKRWDPIVGEDKMICPREKHLPVFNTNMFIAQGVASPKTEYNYFYPNSAEWDESDGRHIRPANAAITGKSIPADNGYVYFIDQVIEPMRTIYGVMEDSTLSFSLMKNFYEKFPGYIYDNLEYREINKEFKIPGVDLYPFNFVEDREFSLTDIGNEFTHSSGRLWHLTSKNSFTGIVPSDEAFDDFWYEYWGDDAVSAEPYENYESLDKLALLYLIKNHFIENDGIIWPQFFKDDFLSTWGYPYVFNLNDDVIHKEICGNGAFYGVKKVMPPAIFKAVTAPAFQTPRFQTFSHLLRLSGLLPTLANNQKEVTLCYPSNDAIKNLIEVNTPPGGAWKVSSSQVKVKFGVNFTNMTPEWAGHLVNSLTFNEKLTAEDFEKEQWKETNLPGVFLKINGYGGVETEGGMPLIRQGMSFEGEGEHENWTAYEIGDCPPYPHPIIDLLLEPTHKDWHGEIGHWRTDLVPKTNHFLGGAKQNLQPFKDYRGIIFAAGESWSNISGKHNIPKNTDKILLTEWLGKHMIAKTVDQDLDIKEFLDATVQDQVFKTLDPEFDLKIKEIISIPVNDPNLKDMGSLFDGKEGAVRIAIELSESQTGLPRPLIVYAYGPLFARDCICYIIPNEENRFVRGVNLDGDN